MLKGIDNRLNADVLHVLRSMTYCDALVPVAQSTVHHDLSSRAHMTAVEAVSALPSVIPLDTCVEDLDGRMTIVGDPDTIPPGRALVPSAIGRAEGRPRPMIDTEKCDFCDRARDSHAVIRTGERRFCGCFILRKRVIGPDE